MSFRLRSLAIMILGLLALNPMSLLAQQTRFAPQTPAARPVVAQPSEAELILDQAAQNGQYTFVLFYKTNDINTSAMNKTLQAAVAKEEGRAVVAVVQVGNPADAALVAKFDVARAPMPMTLSVAPNGAITGIYAQKLSALDIPEAYVTPTMMDAMKALQEGKLVFVTVYGTGKPTTPTALRDLQADPHFGARIVPLVMNGNDPAEAMLMEQMKIDPKSVTTNAALMAPPGVLVGKFAATATKAEIATALAKAGKCCDDPNCKHHQSASTSAAPGAPATKKK